MLFASILDLSVIVGNYLIGQLQQTTLSDAFFFLTLKGLRFVIQNWSLKLDINLLPPGKFSNIFLSSANFFQN